MSPDTFGKISGTPLGVEYPQQVWDEGIRMFLDVPLAIEVPILLEPSF